MSLNVSGKLGEAQGLSSRPVPTGGEQLLKQLAGALVIFLATVLVPAGHLLGLCLLL